MAETPLAKIIRQRIEQLGPMDMGEYMALCLGHPRYGYYMTRDPFGASGDFTTAPEISQMFGEMIGLWIADVWMKMGSPSEFILLECGPGRGTLMGDIMRSTRTLPGLHEAARLYLMEMSPVLQKAQKARLGTYDPIWIDGLEALPSAVPLIVVGNEFLDALPVRQVIRNGASWRERVVTIDQDGMFCFGEKEADLFLIEAARKTGGREDVEGVVEVSFILNQFLKNLFLLLKKQSGIALFMDYGHECSGVGETLQAVQSHRFTSVLDFPGDSDLTAHVDFENVGRIAREGGLVCHGPVTQSRFLRELGIEVRAERLMKGANDVQKRDIESSLKRVIDTEQMGSLFKVIALSYDPKMTLEPAGF